MADVVIGAKLEADASGAINSVKNFKQELRLAQQEVVTLSEKFGATSKEAAAAAMKAAELKDKIGDAASLVDAFNPDTKFRAFGASIQTVVGGFTALTGAMGLLGVESEEVQKTLLKVQSALALSQGIAQLQEGMQAMKNLGAVLVNTLGKSGLMGIAIAGVAALGLAFSGLFRRNQDLIAAQKEYVKGIAAASVEMTKLRNSIDQAKAGVISKEAALKEFNSTLGQTTGETNDLNVAERLLVANADTYIKIQGLKAKANLLLQKSAEAAVDAELAGMGIEKGGTGGTIGGQVDALFNKANKRADDLKNRVSQINAEINALQGTVQKSIGGNIGAAGDTLKPKTAAGQQKLQEVQESDALTRWLAAKNLEAFLEKNKLRKIEADETAKFNEERFKNSSIFQELQTKTEQNNAIARVAVAEAEAEAKMQTIIQVGNVLGGLSELLGRQTAAGKVLAVAEATINTYAAIAGQLKAFAGVPIPGYAIAQAIATGIFGLVQVKKILAVPVPGSSSGGGGSVSSPLAPRLPQSTGTRLDRDQLNQIGNAAVRAFVVESDVTTNQERIRRLNRAARI